MGVVTLRNLLDVVSFGSIEAPTDRVLLEAFEDHPTYRRAIAFTHPIIIGRKGAGKSAIFKKLVAESRDDFVSAGFGFSDYPWAYHNQQKELNVPEEECFRESWKFFIAMMFCKLVVANKTKVDTSISSSLAIRQIESFIKDSYGDGISPARIFSPGRKLKFSGQLKIAGFGAQAETVDVEHLPKFYSEINRMIFDLLAAVLPKERTFCVCFDELDIGFSPKDKNYVSRLIGLIRATKYVNDRFANEERKSGVVLLLRDDIWHILRFEDKNKISQGSLGEIKWSVNGDHHSLKSLMERRFSATIGQGKPVRWEDVFDNQNMPQFKSKLDYIAERGFQRPRDIIAYCNFVLEEFKETSGGNAEIGTRFVNSDVRNAEVKYSKHFLSELEDELHKHSEAYERYFRVLKEMTNVTFSKEEFALEWETRRGLFDSDDNVDRALEALFDFSVVGYLTTGGERRGSGYVWRYEDSRARFDPNARKYQVHLGLKEEFGLRLRAKAKKSRQ